MVKRGTHFARILASVNRDKVTPPILQQSSGFTEDSGTARALSPDVTPPRGR